MKNKNIIKFLVSLFILFILIYKVGFLETIGVLKTTNIIYFTPFTILIILGWIFSGINFKLLLKKIDNRFSLEELTKFSSLSWIFSLITPGKVGELSLILMLRKKKNHYGEASAIIAIDKIISFLSLITIALIGFLYYLKVKSGAGLIITSLLLLILIIILMFSKFTRDLIKNHLTKKLTKKFKRFHKTLEKLIKESKKELFLNFISTNIRWLIGSTGIYILFLSVNTKVSLLYIFVIQATNIILSHIPITIEGLGIKETNSVILFSQVGVAPKIVISVYLLSTVYKYLIGFISSLIFTKDIKKVLQINKKITK